ncbi:MAG: FAD-dependent monooxygenase [Pseudomonadota bacterium]
MNKEPFRIVGGGIAGLTAVLCLAKRGLASQLFERAPQFEEVGAGLQLSPNALKVLFALGLRDKLEGHAVAPSRIAIHSGLSGRPIAHVPLGKTAEQRYGTPYWVMHRADLQRVLVEACTASELITLQTDRDIAPDVGVDDGGDHLPTIAADGVNSRWRSAIRNDAATRFTGTVAWRAVTQSDSSEASNPETQVWFGPNAHLVSYPLRGGRARNLVAIARTNKIEGMLDAFAAWSGDIRDRLMGCRDWSPWPLKAVDPKGAWYKHDTVLLGDSAHAMLPFAAQGAAMAIEDAWVLAQFLSQPVEPAQAFVRFEAARKARVSRVWREAERNGRIYHMTGPMALGRDTVMRASGPQRLLARYDWLYGWSPEGL